MWLMLQILQMENFCGSHLLSGVTSFLAISRGGGTLGNPVLRISYVYVGVVAPLAPGPVVGVSICCRGGNACIDIPV